MQALFDLLQRYGILINLSKCVFQAPDIIFLGYKVSRRGFPTFGRTSNTLGLPPFQDHQSAPTFPWHGELSQVISASCSGPPWTASRCVVQSQSQRLPPHHLNAGAPQDLQKVQGEFVTHHSTCTPRSIHTTCTHHRRLHIRHACYITATCQERLVAPPPPASPRNSTQHSRNTELRTASCWPSMRP
jgi:hypothetical protein